MKLLAKFSILFLVLTIVSSVVARYTTITFGKVDFYSVHNFVFLVCIALFPRLTLLFSTVPFGGILWWAGFVIAPRVLVASLATIAYWQTNPFLVAISWLIAAGGESSEKLIIKRKMSQAPPIKHHDFNGTTIEAEVIKK